MAEVSILIKAIDQASSVLNGVKRSMGDLDTAGANASRNGGGLAKISEKAFFIGNTFSMVTGLVKGTADTINKFTVAAAADMEQTTVAFETLVGGAELARDTIADIQALGASTPFQFPELADAGRKLIAFGTAAEDVESELRRIGDVSAGIQQPIGEIAEIYGKARVSGRLFAEDINQLVGRGIPIISELANQFGVTESQVKTLVTNGEVGFEHLRTAFVNMTSEGGKFNNMMEAQSQTFNGLVSTLQDNVTVVLTRLGAKIIETFDLKGALTTGIDFINNNMPLIESTIDTAFNAITNAIGMGKTAVSGFSEEFSIFWDGLKRIWTTGLHPLLVALGPTFKASFEVSKIALSTLWEVAQGVVESIALLLEGNLSGAVTAFFNVGKDLVQGLLNGIGATLEGVKATVTNLGNNVIGWFKSAIQSQSPSKKMIEEGKNLLEGLLVGLQDPTLRAEIQKEIDVLGNQLFALNMASGSLSPVGMTPPTPSVSGGPNAVPDNGVGGGTTPLAGSLTNPPPLPSPSAMLPTVPLMELNTALAEMASVVEETTSNLTTLRDSPSLASPSAMMPAIPKLSTALESMGFELEENELSLVSVTEANTYLQEASTAASDAILIGSDIQKAHNSVVESSVITVSSFTQTFSSFSDFVATQFGQLGTSILSLLNQLPLFGTALNAGLEEVTNQAGQTIGFLFDPISALIAVMAELFSKSKTFAFLLDFLAAVSEPLAATFDIFLPILKAVGFVFGVLYNALSALVRTVTFGLVDLGQVDLAKMMGIDGIQGGAPIETPEVTTPQIPTPNTSTSTFQEPRQFDVGRLPTAVQFAVFTPFVESVDKLTTVVNRLVDEGIMVRTELTLDGSKAKSPTMRFL